MSIESDLRKRVDVLVLEAEVLVNVLIDQQHDLNMAILATPTGDIRNKLTEMNLKRLEAIRVAAK